MRCCREQQLQPISTKRATEEEATVKKNTRTHTHRRARKHMHSTHIQSSRQRDSRRAMDKGAERDRATAAAAETA